MRKADVLPVQIWGQFGATFDVWMRALHHLIKGISRPYFLINIVHSITSRVPNVTYRSIFSTLALLKKADPEDCWHPPLIYQINRLIT